MPTAAQLTETQTNNFDTLHRAFEEDEVCLLSAVHKQTGETRALICAINHLDDGEVELVPFAELIRSPDDYDPCIDDDVVVPPTPGENYGRVDSTGELIGPYATIEELDRELAAAEREHDEKVRDRLSGYTEAEARIVEGYDEYERELFAEQRVMRHDSGQPIVKLMTCGVCGRSWNDAAVSSRTPTPAGRCPFEYEH